MHTVSVMNQTSTVSVMSQMSTISGMNPMTVEEGHACNGYESMNTISVMNEHRFSDERTPSQ
jgi:hypothetical protein